MNANRNDLRSQFGQDLGRDAVSRAVAAVDHDPQSFQSEMAGKGVLEKDNVSSYGIGNSECLADLRGGRPVLGLPFQNHLFHPRLDLVRELETICREKLYPVILERIVRSGYHHAGIGPHAPGEKRHAWRRQRTDEEDICSTGAYPGSKGRLEHIARQTRVLADKDLITVPCVTLA